jgi:hypothetical protein
MTSRTDVFTSEALRASLRRRLVEIEAHGAERYGWSESDTSLIESTCARLAEHRGRFTLPANGIAIGGYPDVDWSAITPEQLSSSVRSALIPGPVDGPLPRLDMRVAIRRRLCGHEWHSDDPKLTDEDVQHLFDLYEYITAHREGPDVTVPLRRTFDGDPDVDWKRVTPSELTELVRSAYTAQAGAGATAAGEPSTRAASGGGKLRESGATVIDTSSFAAFVQLRARRRDAEAQRLLAERASFRAEADAIRERHFAASEDLFDASTPRSVRAAALRHHRASLERELAEHARERGEVLGRERPWYGKMLERWRTERGDRRDYANALAALYDDRNAARRAGVDPSSVALDPVLIGIPGVRRYRQDGALVYTRRIAGGDAEMFRVFRDTREVVVRSKDAIATEAAIVKAYELDGPPLTFEGADEFRDRCEKIAARHGFEVAAPAVAPRAPAAGGANPTPTSQAAAPSAATSPAPASGTPVPDLTEYGDVVAWVKEQTGVDFVVALDPKHAVPMEPVYLTHTPMKQHGFEVVFVQKPGVEAISAIALPRGTVPAGARSGETRIELAIEHGAWRARFDVAEPTVERSGPGNDVGRSRGR